MICDCLHHTLRKIAVENDFKKMLVNHSLFKYKADHNVWRDKSKEQRLRIRFGTLIDKIESDGI